MRIRPATSRAACRAAVIFSALMLGSLALSATAWAHVTISPQSAAKGGSDLELTFRVPNEEANAGTTELQLYFPAADPIASVLVEPTPGWTATVTNTTLAKPIVTDDGSISQVVSSITWTGGQIKPGQYQGFNVIFGQLPSNTDQIVFKAVQTYSDGNVVRWIDLAAPGQPDPAHPAPVLTLTSAAGAGTTDAAGSASTHDSAAQNTTGDDSTAVGLAAGALALGALAAGLAAIPLLRSRRSAVGPDRGADPGADRR